MNGAVTGYLIVVCEFAYDSQGRTRYLPNDIRRFLMGKAHQEGAKRPRKGLPETVLEKFGSEFIIPLYFALIKLPKIEGGMLNNPAVGAIAIYHVVTTHEKIFKELCLFIHEEIKKHIKVIENIRIFHAKEVELYG